MLSSGVLCCNCILSHNLNFNFVDPKNLLLPLLVQEQMQKKKKSVKHLGEFLASEIATMY